MHATKHNIAATAVIVRRVSFELDPMPDFWLVALCGEVEPAAVEEPSPDCVSEASRDIMGTCIVSVYSGVSLGVHHSADDEEKSTVR